jgi:hypothetical protein
LCVLKNSTAARNKNILHISGRTFLSTEKEGGCRIYDITKCKEPRHDVGTLDNGIIDGVLLDAVRVSEEELADLLTESEEHQRRQARAKASLKEWIEFRQTWSRKRKRKLPLQNKEVSQNDSRR